MAAASATAAAGKGGFDLSKYDSLMNGSRENLVFLARQAQLAERYDDLCKVMRVLVQQGTALSGEERQLLSVAFKNSVGTRRASYRVLVADEQTKENPIAVLFRQQVASEMEAVCADVLDLLQTYLLKDSAGGDDETKVFFLKMAGDYYRYLAEFDPKQYGPKGADFYAKATTLAEAKLEATNPIRLGLALNYSVCFYEVLSQADKARAMAKAAFDAAADKLDTVTEASYKETVDILQLLKDNLCAWNADAQAGGDDDESRE